MKLIVNYKGINKTMLNVQSYDDIVKFVHENFFLKMSKWCMSYIDSDGDVISLDSDMDVKTMFETCDQESMKVYVKDVEKLEDDVKQVGGQFNINQINQTQKIETKTIQTNEEKVKEAKKQEKIEVKQQEMKADQEFSPVIQKEFNHKNNFQRCGGRQMWKKKMQEKMAKFVDQRIESLLPYITKKVEERIQNKEQKPVQSQSKKNLIIHKVKCNICGENEISGIRYKCTKCPLFNLCENCEKSQIHNHNMIKMRFQEQEDEKAQMQSWKPWWKKNQNQSMPLHPFGHMPGMLPGMMPGMPVRPGMPPFNKFPPPFPPNSGQFGQPPHPFMPFNAPNIQKNKQKSCDQRLKITKKCFKLVQMFGGQPKAYEDFVKKNIDLKFDELSKLYKAMNEDAKIQAGGNEKVLQKCQKLSFYFNEPAQNFIKIVQANPASNLKQLLKIIGSSKSKAQDKQKQKVEQTQKKEEPKVLPPPLPRREVLVSPSLMVPPAGKKAMDIQKRNECILDMKELFGPDMVLDYINFYNSNSDLENPQIIQKYLDKLSKK